jgi:hypothetical protein
MQTKMAEFYRRVLPDNYLIIERYAKCRCKQIVIAMFVPLAIRIMIIIFNLTPGALSAVLACARMALMKHHDAVHEDSCLGLASMQSRRKLSDRKKLQMSRFVVLFQE